MTGGGDRRGNLAPSLGLGAGDTGVLLVRIQGLVHFSGVQFPYVYDISSLK